MTKIRTLLSLITPLIKSKHGTTTITILCESHSGNYFGIKKVSKMTNKNRTKKNIRSVLFIFSATSL